MAFGMDGPGGPGSQGVATGPTEPPGGATGSQGAITPPKDRVGQAEGQQQQNTTGWQAYWENGSMSTNQRQSDQTGRQSTSTHYNANPTTYTADDMTAWLGNAWQNAATRSSLLNVAIATGYSPDFKGVSAMWQYAGQKSAEMLRSPQNPTKMTPFQVLNLMSGANAGANAGAGKIQGSTSHSTSSSTSYNISDPATAKALTNAVLQSALGREASPEELAQYRHALNAYEHANPSKSTSSSTGTSDGRGNSTSTSSNVSYGGGSQAGGQQVLEDRAKATTEGQAFQGQNVFEAAMQHLAQRIG